MPIFQRIIPSRGKEFWDSLDSENIKQVLEAVNSLRGQQSPYFQDLSRT